MIFPLLQDLSATLSALPAAHPRRRVLQLLDEALRRDVHFIARHPTTLFQCLWNTCWWYDCPEAAEHYDPPEGGWPLEGPPWEARGPSLSAVLERFRACKHAAVPEAPWLRMLRPPTQPLGAPQVFVFWPTARRRPVDAVAFSPDGENLYCVANEKALALRADSGAASGPEEQDRARQWMNAQARLNVARDEQGSVRVQDAILGIEARIAPEYALTIFKGSGVLSKSPLRGDSIQADASIEEFRAKRVALAPDGKWLAVGLLDGQIRIVNAVEGSIAGYLSGHESTVTTVAFAPNSMLLASGSEDGTVRIWGFRNARPAATLRGHLRPYKIGALATSATGDRIATASNEGSIWLWNAQSGQPLFQVQHRGLLVLRLDFSVDETRVLATTAEGVSYCWDYQNGTLETAGNAAQISSRPHSRLALGKWEADAKDQHVVVELQGVEAAWLPKQADFVTLSGHPARPIWAAGSGSEFLLFELEGPSRSA